MLDVVPRELLPIDIVPGLVLVSDRMPGITRQGLGGDFAYIGPDARPVSPVERTRIAGLAIPPSFADVWICPLANGHIQATARDLLGRKRYQYHPGWRDWSAEAGLAQLLPLGKSLAQLRARIDRDLERQPDDPYFTLASLAALVDCRPAGLWSAGAQRKQQRMLLVRSLRRIDEPNSRLAIGISPQQLDTYLAEISGLGAVTARSLLAWTASTAAFATAVATIGPLTKRAMADAAARTLDGASTATGIAFVDPDVLALADLAEGERREKLDRLPPEGSARLRPAERRYLGFLERSRPGR